MSQQYNSQAFTPEECKKGLHLDLIKFLLEQSKKFEDSYYDIHIDNDGYCTIVEWYDKRFEDEDNEGFRFVDYEHELMYRLDFPDKHYDYFYSKEEAEKSLQEWLKDNPEWKKNEYGRWYNVKEIEEFNAQFIKPKYKGNGKVEYDSINDGFTDDYEIPTKEDQDDYQGKCDVNED